MKKKLVIISDESIISGNARTGVADVTDGLANALADKYEVTVVCPDGAGSIPLKMGAIKEDILRKFSIAGTSYLLVDPSVWEFTRAAVADSVHPDILHNLSDPYILREMSSRPRKTIYTIDHVSYVMDKVDALAEYDYITTVSKGYAEELLAREDAIASLLRTRRFVGITNGITTALCNPHSGIMIPHKFDTMDMRGKIACKRDLLAKHGIEGDPAVFVVICRLIKEKGIASILEVIPHIVSMGGVVLIYGRGEASFEEKLANLTGAQVVWIQNSPKLHRALPILAGADFYLSPSLDEPCGLMPMTACMYGTIPIVTPVGGLKDNFNSRNALVVSTSLKDSVTEAFNVHKNFLSVAQKRRAAMNAQFDWGYRVREYVALYEEKA